MIELRTDPKIVAVIAARKGETKNYQLALHDALAAHAMLQAIEEAKDSDIAKSHMEHVERLAQKHLTTLLNGTTPS